MSLEKKITGLFFGSFNPVHHGHMMIASHLKQFSGLGEIWFIVSPHNPLKEKSSLLDSRQRLHMLNLAVGDCSWMKVSDIELKLPQPSYTIHTLAHLKELFPRKQFALIMGSDSLRTLPKWKNYEAILAHYPIYVYPRKGDVENLPDFGGHIIYTQAPEVEVSSSFIRKAIAEKKDMRYYIPTAAFNYLDEMNFYK
ncbi:MAG: nicotinic acid mononucleotide adenylyltransferase [Bacteroidetes bacterium HGW-Bacteroidetes-21]|jgi:nicotinate-nucleotide adenylyltransferase|nr:MAG: nicotinic acid mononucleotide adenylyltransferase [Bacteroidetes bacterium HGW-Bacteroidetes-21]